MKKTTLRFFSLFFALVMMFCLFLPVYAAETDDPDYLGSTENETGIILPETRAPTFPEDLSEGGYSYKLLFAIKATHVTNLLSSRSATDANKSFYPMYLPDGTEYIICKADLHHSASNDQSMTMRFGLCVLDMSTGDYIKVPGAYKDVRKNGSHDLQVKVSTLPRAEKIYSFIRNISPVNGTDYVFGSVAVYRSTN
ncbi:MAG TPA: hypothetical protein IAC31_02785 [Candidatus Faecousia intestinigallinarum]|nr:hypothetical protein [Candidatus Faecousia intestinigallinarum]